MRESDGSLGRTSLWDLTRKVGLEGKGLRSRNKEIKSGSLFVWILELLDQ